MLFSIKNKLSSILRKDNERSSKIIKNILISFVVKGGSIIIGLLLIPLTIDYVSPIQYGIWITISSIIGWMTFFDIGLGNGLRNSLANAMALKEYDKARVYVSTTYAALFLISTAMFVLFWFVNPHIDWRGFLNIPNTVPDNIENILLIVLCSFCFQFIAQLINTVLTAMHEPAMAGLISFFGQLGVLLAIVVLKITVEGSLRVLVIALTAIPICVLIIANLYFYNSKLKNIAPSFKDINFGYIKDVLNVGGVFFFIQIGALVLFQTNNIILTKVIGPEAVTKYNVAYKLFSVVTMVFTIVVTPYWSAFTDAYAKNDFAWMRKNIKIMKKLLLALSIAAILLLLVSKWLFKLWVGDKVDISIELSVIMTIYVIVYMWQTLFVYFLNGIGVIRLQLFMVLLSAIINIPMAIFLGEKWGVPGVILANILVFICMGITFSIQVNKILNQKAMGIWGK